MTKIDTLMMARKGERIADLIGKRAAATSSYSGRHEGVITEIRDNIYPVITTDDGATFRAGAVIELI